MSAAAAPVVEALHDVTHVRDFSMAHAAAGAPFCTRKGRKVIMYEWQIPGRSPLLGGIGPHRSPMYWRENGRATNYRDDISDLVMLPLGFIDGKPVFVGDSIVNIVGNPLTAYPRDTGFKHCRWPDAEPAAEKDYPKSEIKADDVRYELATGGITATFDTTGNMGATNDTVMQIIGSVALRKAIDAGQVIVPSEAKPGVRPHNPYTGRLRDPRDIESDPMGVAIRHSREPSSPEKEADHGLHIPNVGYVYGFKAVCEYVMQRLREPATSQAERDMAVAKAVKSVAFNAGYTFANYGNETAEVRHIRSAILALDLKAIIAGVKP